MPKTLVLSQTTPGIMKKIEAIIRKSKFDEVRDALHNVNVYFF